MDKKTVVLIAIIGIILSLGLVLLFLRSSADKNVTSNKFLTADAATSEELSIRMDQVEKAVAKLITELAPQDSNTTSGTVNSTSNNSLEARMNNLESSLASLTVSVNQLKTSNSQTTTSQATSNTTQPPLYIPLGWIGSSSSMTWTSITSQTFTLNPADYPGMTSVQFSASMLVYQGNGTAYAQLYNTTDNNVMYGSSISTTSQNYTTVTSTTFQVPKAQKTYVLQLLANTGYAAMMQGAWLRINF